MSEAKELHQTTPCRSSSFGTAIGLSVALTAAFVCSGVVNAAEQGQEAQNSVYQADRARWNSIHEKVKTLPWVATIEPPTPNDAPPVVYDRKRALDHAEAAINTRAWKEVTANHPEFRDVPIVTDFGPLKQTIGSLMACMEMTITQTEAFPIVEPVVKFNPPLVPGVGRYAITMTGLKGPGRKPVEWDLYLKKMDTYFYGNEVNNDGKPVTAGNQVAGEADFYADRCK